MVGAIIESWGASQMLDVDAESCVDKQVPWQAVVPGPRNGFMVVNTHLA